MDNTSGIVVALSGFKRSGKDTVADLLVKKAEMIKENLGIERILKTSFAEPFKEMARLVLDIREEDIEDKEAPIKYTKRWFGEDLSWRQILIRLGEGMKEVISPSVWTLALENRIYNGLHSCTSGNFLAVIPDVRYAQELKLIHKLRKMHWRVFHYGIFRTGGSLVSLLKPRRREPSSKRTSASTTPSMKFSRRIRSLMVPYTMMALLRTLSLKSSKY